MGGWNRATRRRMSKFGLGEQEMRKQLNATWEKAEINAERFAFSGMILALVQKFNFPADQVHELAMETMRNIHGGFCASQLIDKVKELTGFDVDEPLDEFEVNVLEESDDDLEEISLALSEENPDENHAGHGCTSADQSA